MLYWFLMILDLHNVWMRWRILVKIKNMRCNFFLYQSTLNTTFSNKYSYITNYLTFKKIFLFFLLKIIDVVRNSGKSPWVSFCVTSEVDKAEAMMASDFSVKSLLNCKIEREVFEGTIRQVWGSHKYSPLIPL